MRSLVAKMRLRREEQLECYIGRTGRVGEEFVRLVVVQVYGGTEGSRTILIESVVIVSLIRPIFEEVLGGVGAIVDLGDILDCLVLDFWFYGFGFS